MQSFKLPASMQKFQKRVEDNRKVYENVRQKSLKSIHDDLRKVAQREIDYSKSLLEVLIPVKIKWNEKAWDSMKEQLPIIIEFENEDGEPSDDEEA